MKSFMKFISALLALIFTAGLCGCTILKLPPENHADSSPAIEQTAVPTAVPTEEPTEKPTEAPTPEPTDSLVTLGFVGDIMTMQCQVKAAYSGGSYNFKRCFEPMKNLFDGADLLCGNLETPIAGEKAGYSGPYPTTPPATTDNPNPARPFQTFNAPDQLVYDLKDVGFDMLTTANNHCLDRGLSGLLRTAASIRNAGMYQTGTFLSIKDKATPLIVEIKGIKFGFVAFSAGFNMFDRKLSSNEQFAISKFYDDANITSQIENCKKAGAEFIVAFPHCGNEYTHTPTSTHKKMFRHMIELGCDAIIASHPHYVQPMEWVDIERDDGTTVHAPIVYSLGNFIANMSPSPKDYGLFVQLIVKKIYLDDGSVLVKATSLRYLPVYCIKQNVNGTIVHQTLPCYENISGAKALAPLSEKELKELEKCRKYVIKICGKEYLLQ